MMRTWYFYLILLSGLLLFANCRKESEETEPPVRYDIYTNPSDPALMTIATPEDAFITYYGQRDPYYFDKLSVLFPDEHDEYVMFLDLYGRPVQIYAADGAAYIFLWHNDRRFLMSAISPSGDIQVSVPVHLDSLNIIKDLPSPGKHYRSRDVRISSEDILPATGNKATAVPGIHQLELEKCSAPIQHALVILNTYPVIGRNLYLGETTGEGFFFVQSPGSQSAVSNPDELCRNITAGLDQQLKMPFWSYLYELLGPNGEILSDILTNEIIAAFPKEPSTKILLESCEKAISMLTLAAEIAYESTPAEVCRDANPVYITSEPLNYTCSITVIEPGEEAYTTESFPFNPNGSSSWNVEVPGSATARARFTEPEDPLPAQDYEAKAFVICADESGTDVKLRIEGTDGYFKEDYLVIYNNTMVSLDIPGGGKGVRDVITINILEKEWKLSIIF